MEQADFWREQLSHTEHVLRPLARRYSPDARWLRCEGSINEQQIRTGGGKTTAISQFFSPASSTLSGQENRSGERRAVGGGEEEEVAGSSF